MAGVTTLALGAQPTTQGAPDIVTLVTAVRRPRRLLMALAVVALIFGLAACDVHAEQDDVALVNATRAANNAPALHVDAALTDKARALADQLAQEGRLQHSANLASGVRGPWSLLGENLGFGQSIADVHGLLLASAHHFATMIDPRFTEIGVGVAHSANGLYYVVEEYQAP